MSHLVLRVKHPLTTSAIASFCLLNTACTFTCRDVQLYMKYHGSSVYADRIKVELVPQISGATGVGRTFGGVKSPEIEEINSVLHSETVERVVKIEGPLAEEARAKPWRPLEFHYRYDLFDRQWTKTAVRGGDLFWIFLQGTDPVHLALTGGSLMERLRQTPGIAETSFEPLDPAPVCSREIQLR